MKRTKILIALLLVLAMSLSLFAGCSSKPADNSANNGSNVTDEPTNNGETMDNDSKNGDAFTGEVESVVLYLITFNNIPDDYSQINDAINQHIAETYPEASVALDLKLFGPAEYQDKINLAMQSGTPMDIYIPLGIQSFIAKNQCYPLEDLLEEYGQGIVDILNQDFGPDAFATFKKDGHIYGVPVNRGNVATPTLTYDQDMLDAIGVSIDDINSIRDLPAVFDKIMETYPDVYPFTGTNAQDSGIIMILKGENDMDSLSDTINMGVVFGDDSTVLNLYESETFYEYIGMMRDWYNKGYMPKDMATSTSTMTELMAAGRVFCSWAGYGGNAIQTTISATTGRNVGGKWIAPFYFDSLTSGLAMSISSMAKVPEAAMKLLDIIYTDEFVINTILFGIEDVDYVKVDEHHWTYPEGLDPNTVSYTAAYCTGVIGSESLMLQPVGVSYDDVLLKLQMNRDNKRSPFFGFTFDPSAVINEMTALQNVYDQYMPGLLCGSLDPDIAIAEYNEALKEAGIDNVIAEKQQQLDAWIAANQ